jgi:hypothetical protein
VYPFSLVFVLYVVTDCFLTTQPLWGQSIKYICSGDFHNSLQVGLGRGPKITTHAHMLWVAPFSPEHIEHMTSTCMTWTKHYSILQQIQKYWATSQYQKTA